MSSPSLRPLIDTCQKCSTSPVNHEARSPANGSFQNPGVCPQAVPSFLSLPYPHRSFFGSRPIFRAGKIPKTPFLGLSLLPNPTETLARQARSFSAGSFVHGVIPESEVSETCKESMINYFLLLSFNNALVTGNPHLPLPRGYVGHTWGFASA